MVLDMQSQVRRGPAALIGTILLLSALGCGGSRTGSGKRESILDHVVHTSADLVLEVPAVFRWCDRLDLTRHRIDVGDCELYVEEEGHGPPLVLINGGPGGTHHYFHPWFSRAAEYARVIYYDQRGCGRSDFDPGAEGYSVEQAVGDLDAIRAALGIEQWVLLGYSYGGFLAQYYATRHPRSVAGLVLVGASPGMSVGPRGSRRNEFLSEEERARLAAVAEEVETLAEMEGWPREEYSRVFLYNHLLNGGWKGQHFYKPSPERMAQMARYEWVHDLDFNSTMSDAQGRVCLAGVFDACPIPTLILEGHWDLTWNEEKRHILHHNHPNARMVVFENAGHGIYDEEPERFFATLREFIETLPSPPPDAVTAWYNSLEAWRQEIDRAPRAVLDHLGWGRASNERIVRTYNRTWFAALTETSDVLRTGFALYDLEHYEEALLVFERLERDFRRQGNTGGAAMALVWQGHMLDLLGRRAEAVALYRQVAHLDREDTWQHGQFGMRYKLSPYAAERVASPFQRIENRIRD